MSNEGSHHLIRNLPSEVFVNWIFPNLHPVDICRCRCVCKVWLSWTITYFRLVKNLNFCDGFSEYYLDEAGLLTVICRLFNLRHIKLDGLWRCATEVNLIKLAHRCRRLEILSIPSCRGVTDKVLKAVSVNCPHLIVLDVSRCHQVGTRYWSCTKIVSHKPFIYLFINRLLTKG